MGKNKFQKILFILFSILFLMSSINFAQQLKKLIKENMMTESDIYVDNNGVRYSDLVTVKFYSNIFDLRNGIKNAQIEKASNQEIKDKLLSLKNRYGEFEIIKVHTNRFWGDTLRINKRTKKIVSVPDLSQKFKLKFANKVPVDLIVQELSLSPEVKFAEPPVIAYTCAIPNDPWYTSDWASGVIQAENAWDITKGSSNVVISINDRFGTWEVGTGVHEDLVGKVIYHKNKFGDHGTCVASVASANTNNNLGISSLGWNLSLMFHDWVAADIDDAVQSGADIINFSWITTSSTAYAEECSTALAQGVVLVAAAGNEQGPPPHVWYPATHNFGATGQVIAVSGTEIVNSNEVWVDWWNYSPGTDPINNPTTAFIDCAAPGVDIPVAAVDDLYTSTQGTSFAAPRVSALVGLILSINISLTPNDIYQIITQTTDKIGIHSYDANGWNRYLGYGRINAYNALKYTLENYGGTLTQDLSIPSGETWIFQPGITLTFQNNSSLIVDGTLTANGTSSDKIIFDFVSNQSGIEVNFGGNLTMSHAIVKNAYTGINILPNATLSSIENSTIQNSYNGIVVEYGSKDVGLTIENNVIENHLYSGIKIYNPGYGMNFEPSITDNLISNCSDGIYLTGAVGVEIQGSTIEDCTNGIYIYNASPVIIGNEILEPENNGIYGEANGKAPLIQGNKIKKTSGLDYQGIYLLNYTNPYITENDIQGFTYGIYYGGGGTGRFMDGSLNTPSINNRLTGNYIGLTVAYGSYLAAGLSSPYAGSNNSIYNNTHYDATAYENGEIIAHKNWWGTDGAQLNIYSGGYIDPRVPLTSDPWSGIPLSPSGGGDISDDLLSLSQRIPSGQKISNNNLDQYSNGPMSSSSSGNNPNNPADEKNSDEMIIGFNLEKEGKIEEAVNHYKEMIEKDISPGFALARLVELKNRFDIKTIEDYLKILINTDKAYRYVVLNLLAGINLDNSKYEDAVDLYNLIIEDYPNSYESTNARFEKFFAALHIKKDKELAGKLLSEIQSAAADLPNDDADFLMRLETAEYLLYGTEYNSANRSAFSKQNIIAPNLPKEYALLGNYPNPFNPSTTISYTLPNQSAVELIIYDVMGREIKTFSMVQNAGRNNIVWDGMNNSGENVSSGIYLYRIRLKSLESNEAFEKTAKLMLMK